MSAERLIFVYNADAGIGAGLLDHVHKTVSPSTYQCSLCGVTYGLLGMKRQWRDWLNKLPYESVFLHRPDFRAAYPAFAHRPLPLIARESGGVLTEVLGAADLAALPNLDALIAALPRETSRTTSPLVTHIAWGRIEAEGLGEAKDLKLFPGGGRQWDWRETGTQHVPGIQPTDVDDLIGRGCKTVILSRGMHLVLKTQPKTIAHLETRGIAVEVLETRAAVARYNELAAQGVAVGGLFHSTC